MHSFFLPLFVLERREERRGQERGGGFSCFFLVLNDVWGWGFGWMGGWGGGIWLLNILYIARVEVSEFELGHRRSGRFLILQGFLGEERMAW